MVFILSIIGMICWGITPMFIKIGLRNVDPLAGLCVRTLFTMLLVIICITACGNWIQLKYMPPKTILLLAIEATLATLIGDLAYFAAIKHGAVSLVTVIMSSSPLVTLICSITFLGEQMTIVKFAGILFVISGIIMIA